MLDWMRAGLRDLVAAPAKASPTTFRCLRKPENTVVKMKDNDCDTQAAWLPCGLQVAIDKYMRSPPTLSQPFSLYLDLARFVAASLVVSAHYLQSRLATGDMSRFLPDMGREAVIIFFVMSGFVIAYTSQRKNASAREYVAARVGRIYSVAIPTLALAFACAAVLAGVDGTLPAYQLDKPHVYVPLHLLFVGQSWSLSEVPPLLVPYWSLCYEVWYYVLFGVAFYMRGWRRVAAVVATLAIMGFKLWLLLPVWLSGVALFHLQSRYDLPRHAARIGFVLSLLALAVYNVAGLESQLRDLAKATWPNASVKFGSADRFLADYVVCIIVMANFWCARFADLSGLVRHGDIIRRFSSYTFTLYLGHMIVISMWLAYYPHNGESLPDLLGLTLLIAAVTLILGQVTEHRKEIFRMPVDRLLRRSTPDA